MKTDMKTNVTIGIPEVNSHIGSQVFFWQFNLKAIQGNRTVSSTNGAGKNGSVCAEVRNQIPNYILFKFHL